MKNIVHSPLEPTALSKWIAGVLVITYVVVSLIPLAWILMTSLRTPQDAIAYPPKVVTETSLIGYVNLFTTRSRVSAEDLAAQPPPATWYEKLVREQQMILAGPSRFADRYTNSLIIGFGSTLLSVVLGTLAAYAFSRFRVPGKDDLLFFILSTRMMPPIAIAIPVYLMFRAIGLSDTHLGLILLYTVVQDLHDVRAPDDLAPVVGEELGAGALLLRRLPQAASRPRCGPHGLTNRPARRRRRALCKAQ